MSTIALLMMNGVVKEIFIAVGWEFMERGVKNE